MSGSKASRGKMIVPLLAVSVLLFFAGVPVFPVAPAFAQDAIEATVPLSEVQRQVSQAQFASAATIAAVQRRSDRVLRQQRFEIDELRAEVDVLRDGGTKDRASLDVLRDQLAGREAAFVAELAARDQVYAEEIATLRRAVEDFAATPEGLAALQRFNDGDEAGALAVLERMRSVRDLAAARRIAQLALDARNRAAKGVTTLYVIGLYAEITRLGPEAHRDWVELGRLYTDAGDLGNALVAARRAEATAADDRDRSVALDAIGDVQVAQGDLPGALQSYQRSLGIRERLAAADPDNTGWQRDLSVSLDRVGDVQLAQGDLPGALQSYQRSLGIAERLAAADPGNAGWQRDLSVSLDRVGDVQLAQGDLLGALQSYQRSLGIRERLAAADPGNAGWQRDLSVSLERVGDVQVAQGDLPGALQSYQRSLGIRERLAAADPGNAGWQSDLSVALDRVGDVQVTQGDLPGALQSFLRSLGIRERLAAADPGNAGWQRDVWVSMWRLQQFPDSGIAWKDIVAKLEALDARGLVMPSDRQAFDYARQEATKEEP
ncbi:MAG: hypothetical protein INF92_03950 [Rhodobacter sp.]|nr:hypothetical protein [Rhodobacter sp.]